MSDFYDCVLLKHGIAWAVGAGIFLLTALLVSQRIIGFYLSLLLMLIALGASMTIEHREEATVYWNKYLPESFHITEGKTLNATKSVKDTVTKKQDPSPIVTPQTGVTSPPKADADKPKGYGESFAEPGSEKSKI